jgi:sulfite exporter TauE/SafE
MIAVISAGFAMGLGASVNCLGTCVPLLVPFTATAENPTVRGGVISAVFFSLGRLIALAGLLVVFWVVKETITISPTVTAVAMMISGIIMIASGLTAFGVFNRPSFLSRLVCRQMSASRSPLYLGVLAGSRPCGPLVAAMAYMLTLPGIVETGVFLVFFWLASSLFLLAVGAVSSGLAVTAGKKLGVIRIRRIAAMAMMVIGVVLMAQGVGLLLM